MTVATNRENRLNFESFQICGLICFCAFFSLAIESSYGDIDKTEHKQKHAPHIKNKNSIIASVVSDFELLQSLAHIQDLSLHDSTVCLRVVTSTHRVAYCYN